MHLLITSPLPYSFHGRQAQLQVLVAMRNLHACICRLRIELDICLHGCYYAPLCKSCGGTHCLRSASVKHSTAQSATSSSARIVSVEPPTEEALYGRKQQPRCMPACFSCCVLTL
ncbi:hypothetical protein MTO96_003211 [Rhipicephalus appendiculatus]